jgi:hypothetical protein
VTVVADREADIYPSWASVPETNFHMLGRAMSDRLLAGGGTLFTAAAQFLVAGRSTIELRAHDPARPKRTAVVELRYDEAEIRRPRDEHDHTLSPTVRLRLVDVQEINPPEGVEPLHWRLLTTHEIADAAAAWQIVGWYQLRSIIEQLFRVMKSQGLRLEACPRALDPGDSQLAPRPRIGSGACPERRPGAGFRKGRLGGTAGEARRGGDESSVRGYPTDAGPRRDRSDAGVQRVQRTGNRHPCGARTDA